MQSLNRITLIGHLGKDPESIQTKTGKPMVRLSLATSESYKAKNEEWQKTTEWHNIVLFGYAASNALKSLKKGSCAFVEGKISSNKYTGKNGEKKVSYQIMADKCLSLDARQPEDGYAKKIDTHGALTGKPEPDMFNDSLPF